MHALGQEPVYLAPIEELTALSRQLKASPGTRPLARFPANAGSGRLRIIAREMDDERKPTLAVLLLDEHGSATRAERLPADRSASSEATASESAAQTCPVRREARVRQFRPLARACERLSVYGEGVGVGMCRLVCRSSRCLARANAAASWSSGELARRNRVGLLGGVLIVFRSIADLFVEMRASLRGEETRLDVHAGPRRVDCGSSQELRLPRRARSTATSAQRRPRGMHRADIAA